MRTAIHLVAALLLAAVSGPATAATLGIKTKDAPIISGQALAFNDPLLGFDVLGDGAASSTAPAAATDLLVTVPLAEVAPAPTGALFVTLSDGTSFLSGDLTAVGFEVDPLGDDLIELLFEHLDGTAAGAFGRRALLVLVGEFGADPIGTGFGSFADPVEAKVSVLSAVPLPAAGVSLLLGLGGLFGIGLSRNRLGMAAQ